MSGDKKLIYFLVALIIFLAIILLIKIKITPKYDSELYDDIYSEYENIFGKENDINEIDIYTEKLWKQERIIADPKRREHGRDCK